MTPVTLAPDPAPSPMLVAVPYNVAYADLMAPIAVELRAAADAMTDPNETALVTYLRAAASAFETNDWPPADEAWAAMNARNSRWYVRVGPDETYWEPCSLRAGYHLSFARINQGSKNWQTKLVPVQQEMEDAIAAKAGAPYKSRKVTFHLPDFIDIVVNAGDDRDPCTFLRTRADAGTHLRLPAAAMPARHRVAEAPACRSEKDAMPGTPAKAASSNRLRTAGPSVIPAPSAPARHRLNVRRRRQCCGEANGTGGHHAIGRGPSRQS